MSGQNAKTPKHAGISGDDGFALQEAKKLLDARYYCSNEELSEAMSKWATTLLEPLVKAGSAEAQWLISGNHDGRDLTQEEMDQKHLQRLKEGAAAELPDAMFYLAHHHYEKAEYEEAAILYRKAADTGHAYAKWCLGLDLISGVGVAQDQAAGLKLIEEAGNLYFEGAIQFMSDAYALGKYGFPQDECQAATWQRKLANKNLIRF
ncbi:tetratricopeptide repeat protein [Yoonia sp. 2307UL14-13]|uniref:tetratricopeptide repeat protein n=1 Tax=Yoonia sp. 2307UL14-13 TaxID=3126506 RepID=UPI0030AE2BEB